MATPYELLNKLQASASKSEEEKLEEEAKRKLAKGEALSAKEKEVLEKDEFSGIEDVDMSLGPKGEIQEEAKPMELEKPVGLEPTPDRVYNAPLEEKPKTVLEAAKQAEKKTLTPEPIEVKEPAPTLKEKIKPEKDRGRKIVPETAAEQKAPTPKTIQSTLKERLAGLDARRQEAKASREERRKATEWGELASIIGRSLAQIGAAQQGLRTGVDMSNAVKPLLVDWERKKDRIDNDYAQEIKEIEGERREINRLAEKAEDQETREKYREEDYKRQKELANIKYQNRLKNDNAKGILAEAKALMRGDEASFKNNIAAEKAKISDYEQELKGLNKVKALIAADDKRANIVKAATPFLGDLVEKNKYFGLIDSTKSNEEIEQLANQRIEALTNAINQANSSIKRQQEQVVRLKSTTPEQYARKKAPAPRQAPAEQEKNPDIQEYADKFMGGDYNKAYQFLKNRGDI